MTKICDVLNTIDDFIHVYSEHKNTIRLVFGGLDVEQIGNIISNFKRGFGK